MNNLIFCAVIQLIKVKKVTTWIRSIDLRAVTHEKEQEKTNLSKKEKKVHIKLSQKLLFESNKRNTAFNLWNW